jgi:predicted acylesterase/phospholipase RssA
MREYSPRRRTALVLTGSGTSGAYHAGVLKALDESGVKLDLVVGSGVGAVGAAFGAAAGGPRLYGERGFWADVSWDGFFRLRPAIRIAILLLACSFGVFLLPVLLALTAGLLFPLVLILDLVSPGWAGRVGAAMLGAPSVLRAPYLAPSPCPSSSCARPACSACCGCG